MMNSILPNSMNSPNAASNSAGGASGARSSGAQSTDSDGTSEPASEASVTKFSQELAEVAGAATQTPQPNPLGEVAIQAADTNSLEVLKAAAEGKGASELQNGEAGGLQVTDPNDPGNPGQEWEMAQLKSKIAEAEATLQNRGMLSEGQSQSGAMESMTPESHLRRNLQASSTTFGTAHTLDLKSGEATSGAGGANSQAGVQPAQSGVDAAALDSMMSKTGVKEAQVVANQGPSGPLASTDGKPLASRPGAITGNDFLSLRNNLKAGRSHQGGQTSQPGLNGPASAAQNDLSSGASRVSGSGALDPSIGRGLEQIDRGGASGFSSELGANLATYSRRADGEGDPSFSAEASVQGAQRFAGSQQPKTLPKVDVNATVVKGGEAKDRFTSQSVSGITSQIGDLASVGGGEMRIRLKPENLGEMTLQVRTQGDQVGLRIQTANPVARQILEDSLPYLKESLLGQRLALTNVDLSLSSASSSRSDSAFDSSNQQNSNQGFDLSQSLDRDSRGGRQSDSQNLGDPHFGSDAPASKRPVLSGLSSISGSMSTFGKQSSGPGTSGLNVIA